MALKDALDLKALDLVTGKKKHIYKFDNLL